MDINEQVKQLVKEVLETDKTKERFVYPFRTEIYKEMTMDASHQLPNHKGKCSRHHGHTYTVGVCIESFLLDKTGDSQEGMVIDHAHLKEAMKTYIDNEFDHQFLNTTLKIVIEGGDNTSVHYFRTTAEQIAWWVFITLDQVLSNSHHQAVSQRHLQVTQVDVWETPTSRATAKRKDFDPVVWADFIRKLNHKTKLQKELDDLSKI